MKNLSSNKSMEDPLDILTKIKEVSPPDNLREVIFISVKNRKTTIIPLFWVRSVAVLAVIILSAESFVAFNSTLRTEGQASISIESIAPILSNQLYHE